MSRAVEETDRRLLRARDAMDRASAQSLDVATLARIAHVSPARASKVSKQRSGVLRLMPRGSKPTMSKRARTSGARSAAHPRKNAPCWL